MPTNTESAASITEVGKLNNGHKDHDFFSAVASDLNRSFQKNGIINRADGINLPSYISIKKIADRLIALLFPGFICNDKPNTQDLTAWCITKLSDIYSQLQPEIMQSMRFAERDNPVGDYAALSADLTRRFLNKLPEISGLVASDISAAFMGDPAAESKEEIILCYPGVYAVALYRLANRLYGLRVPLIPRMIGEFAHRQTGIDIHPGATIGKSFFIDHGTGVVIGETTKIGDNVKIYQNVTLGALSFKKNSSGRLERNKRHPTLGNNVIIYSGSSLLGGKTNVGDNCVVGSNLWITASIPPDTTVVYNNPTQTQKVLQGTGQN